MSKDLRELIRREEMKTEKLSKSHRMNFEDKLQKKLHSPKKKNYFFLKIAASFLLMITVGSSIIYFSNVEGPSGQQTAKIESLGRLSPELKSIETYYLASIQTEIASLEETPENKEMIEGYLEKLSELGADYKLLTDELNQDGINEKTINALIENLQLRLKLLLQLKKQLENLQKINNNESVQV